MIILVQSNSETKDLFKEVKFPQIFVKDIRIDESKKEIAIPMMRKDYQRKNELSPGKAADWLLQKL